MEGDGKEGMFIPPRLHETTAALQLGASLSRNPLGETCRLRLTAQRPNLHHKSLSNSIRCHVDCILRRRGSAVCRAESRSGHRSVRRPVQFSHMTHPELLAARAGDAGCEEPASRCGGSLPAHTLLHSPHLIYCWLQRKTIGLVLLIISF